MPARTLARNCTLCLALLAPFIQIGCATHPPLPDVAPGPYAGPPLGLDASGEGYVVVARAPTAGWVITLDRDAEQYRYRALFVTLRKPNPSFLYPQVQVEQRVSTNVPPSVTVQVFARVLGFSDSPGEQPYLKAAENEGRPAHAIPPGT